MLTQGAYEDERILGVYSSPHIVMDKYPDDEWEVWPAGLCNNKTYDDAMILYHFNLDE